MEERGIFTSYSAPESLNEGDELTVDFTVKNIGASHGVLGGFKVKLYIDDRLYDTEPDLYWKSLDHGETWSDHVDTIGSLWSMPEHDVFVRVYLFDKGIAGVQDYCIFYVRAPKAKGEITLCNINALPCPDCGNAEKYAEIDVIAEMKNIGNKEGEFRFYILGYDGVELSKEPDYSYKNVKAGENWRVEKSLLANLNFEMLNRTLNGKLKLVRQT